MHGVGALRCANRRKSQKQGQGTERAQPNRTGRQRQSRTRHYSGGDTQSHCRLGRVGVAIRTTETDRPPHPAGNDGRCRNCVRACVGCPCISYHHIPACKVFRRSPMPLIPLGAVFCRCVAKTPEMRAVKVTDMKFDSVVSIEKISYFSCRFDLSRFVPAAA